MENKCCVPTCIDSSKKKRKNGTKQESIFSAPQSAKLRSLWSKILNVNLDKHSGICEHHFEEKYIIRRYSSGLKQKKSILKKNAIPNPYLNKQTKRLVSNKKKKNFNVYVTNIWDSSMSHENEEFEPYDSDEVSHDEIMDENDFKNIMEETFSEKNILDNQNDLKDFICEISKRYVKGDLQTALKSSNTQLSENSTELNVQQKSMGIYEISEYFQTNPIPIGWSWIINFKKIIFININGSTLEKKCCIIIREDLSYLVTTNDQKISIAVPKISINSPEDILSIMQEVENLKICEGTGLIKNRSKKCAGIVPENKLSDKMRCNLCEDFRRQQLCNRANKITIRECFVNINPAFKKTDLNFTKLNSSEKSNGKFVATNQLEEKIMVKNAIFKLPKRQREFVQLYFNQKNPSTNVSNYSMSLLNECLLMYIRSNKLYNYIRSRNIIPIPPKDVLLKFVNEILPSSSKGQLLISNN